MSGADVARCAGLARNLSAQRTGLVAVFREVVNVLYATVVCCFSNVALNIPVVLAVGPLLHLGLTSPQGDVIGS